MNKNRKYKILYQLQLEVNKCNGHEIFLHFCVRSYSVLFYGQCSRNCMYAYAICSISIQYGVRLIVLGHNLVVVAAWLSGSELVSVNEVTLRRARLVGWVPSPGG